MTLGGFFLHIGQISGRIYVLILNALSTEVTGHSSVGNVTLFTRATLCVIVVFAVFAVVRCLCVCLCICPSQAGIVSKRLNHILKLFRSPGSPSIQVLTPCTVPNSKRNPVSGGAKYTLQLSTEITVYLGNGTRYRPMITMER